MSFKIPYEGICKTDYGRYRVKMEPNNLYIGGSEFCVQLSYTENDTTMHTLSTDTGGCELNNMLIRGDYTIKMTDIAFSISRKYYNNKSQIVKLLDDSGFTWKIDKKRKYKTNFLKGYLLIHRKTWYEDKFNATMENKESYKIYREKADKNFDDPEKMPSDFNFINETAKELLEPLYKSSNTWGEFINKFIDKYDKRKYELMYEWYRRAIYIIFDGLEIDQYWVIDISKRPIINCNELISGGSRYTKKKRRITFSKYKPLEPFNTF